MPQHSFPITLTGFAAIVAACIVIMRTGLRKSILNPYLFVCLGYFRFFGFPLDDREYASVVDLANLLAFVCFSIAFFQAMSGPNSQMREFLHYIWPSSREEKMHIPPLSQRTTIVLSIIVLSYLALNLWLNSLIYGGVGRALVRFYVLSPDNDVSPWLLRITTILSRLAVFIVFVTRFNYLLYRRGRLAMWLTLAVELVVAFPTGSAGKLIRPVFVWVIADILAALRRNRRLRPRLGIVALCAFAICGATFLHVIRATPFKSLSAIAEVAQENRQDMPNRLLVAGIRAHTQVSEETAFCLKTFGRREDFLLGHTFYTILVNPVPRELWPNKPMGFGRLLVLIRQGKYKSHGATSEGISFAAGLAGEGYANGGYLGIVLLSVIVGCLCGKAAKCAAIALFAPSFPVVVLGLVSYRVSAGFVRGDVLNSWVATVYPLFLLIFMLVSWVHFAHFLSTACRGYRVQAKGPLLYEPSVHCSV